MHAAIGESSAPLVVVPGVLGLLKRAQHLPVDVLGLGALAVLGADVVPTAPDGKPQGRNRHGFRQSPSRQHLRRH